MTNDTVLTLFLLTQLVSVMSILIMAVLFVSEMSYFMKTVGFGLQSALQCLLTDGSFFLIRKRLTTCM
jgi:hypothetical protein